MSHFQKGNEPKDTGKNITMSKEQLTRAHKAKQAEIERMKQQITQMENEKEKFHAQYLENVEMCQELKAKVVEISKELDLIPEKQEEERAKLAAEIQTMKSIIRITYDRCKAMEGKAKEMRAQIALAKEEADRSEKAAESAAASAKSAEAAANSARAHAVYAEKTLKNAAGNLVREMAQVQEASKDSTAKFEKQAEEIMQVNKTTTAEQLDMNIQDARYAVKEAKRIAASTIDEAGHKLNHTKAENAAKMEEAARALQAATEKKKAVDEEADRTSQVAAANMALMRKKADDGVKIALAKERLAIAKHSVFMADDCADAKAQAQRELSEAYSALTFASPTTPPPESEIPKPQAARLCGDFDEVATTPIAVRKPSPSNTNKQQPPTPVSPSSEKGL